MYVYIHIYVSVYMIYENTIFVYCYFEMNVLRWCTFIHLFDTPF